MAPARHRLGGPGHERIVATPGFLIGRYPVVNAHLRDFVAAGGLAGPAAAACEPGLGARLQAGVLADHPATGLTRPQAEAFCAWASRRLKRRVRLPTGDEWEAAARGMEGVVWPWGDSFHAENCASAESGWGTTMPVTAHPGGRSPWGAEQMAGNVWEWVSDTTPDGWGVVRGGSYLDAGHGLCTWRALPADPERATPTTGFRIVLEPREPVRRPDE